MMRRFEAVLVLTTALLGACSRSSEPNGITETRSAVTAAAKTPIEVAAAAYQADVNRRASIDSLKSQLATMPESAAKQALLQQLTATLAEQVPDLARVGVPPSGAVEAASASSPRSEAQIDSLKAKIGRYDMKNPADVAEWARVKAQELGQ